MLFSELQLVAADNKFKLQRNGVDATLLEHAIYFANSLGIDYYTCRARCQHVSENRRPAETTTDKLDGILEAARQLGRSLSQVATCLSNPGVREQLRKANPDVVKFAGEVASSFTEAVYQAATGQYRLVWDACTPLEIFLDESLRRPVYPYDTAALDSSIKPLPCVVEIPFDASSKDCLRDPELLLSLIVQSVLSRPSLDLDELVFQLDKEYHRAIQSEEAVCLTRPLTRAEAAKWLNEGVAPGNPSDFIKKRIKAGAIHEPIGTGHQGRYRVADFPEPYRDNVR